MKNLQWAYEQYRIKEMKYLGIENGLMGYALSAYILYRKEKKENISQNVDGLIDRIIEELSNSSSFTIRELADIGLGFCYLIHEGYLIVENVDIECVDLYFLKRMQNSQLDMADTIIIGLYFCSRMRCNTKSIVHFQRPLLKCQEILSRENNTTVLDSMSLQEYFSFLSDLFHLNIFRFKTILLFHKALIMLQDKQEILTSLEKKRCGSIIGALMKNTYIHSYIQKQSEVLYEWVMGFAQHHDKNVTSKQGFPQIEKEMDQAYLLLDDFHTFLLLSPPPRPSENIELRSSIVIVERN